MTDYAKEAVAFERAVEKECSILMRKDADEWESKNRAIVQLTHMVTKYETMDLDHIQEIFGMSIFRILKEPLKFMMSDLRSQQVRDTCTFLSTLSVVLGDHVRHFLRDLFPYVLDGVKQTNKVMSGYVDECIVTMIRNSTFKTCIPIIIEQMQHSKSKLYRERCIDYINEIIVSWDITDKDAEMLNEAIRCGLEDASVRCREISRLAYLNMFQMYPQKTEAMKMTLNKNVQKRLNSEEDKFMASEEYQQGQRQLDALETIAASHESGEAVEDLGLHMADNLNIMSPSTKKGDEEGEGEAGENLADLQQPPPTISRVNSSSSDRSPVSLRARRQSVEEGSVTSIQAVVRGALSRRMSALKASERLSDGGSEGCPVTTTVVAAAAAAAAASPALKSTRGAIPTPGSVAKSPSTGPDSVFDRLSAAKPSHKGLPQPTGSGTPPTSDTKKAAGMPASGQTTGHAGHSVYSSTGKFTSASATKTRKQRTAADTPATAPSRAALSMTLNDGQKKQAVGLLKLKLAYTMKLVDKNMDLIRRLEGGENVNTNIIDDGGEQQLKLPAVTEGSVAEMMALSSDEVSMCRHFEDHINTMLLAPTTHSLGISEEEFTFV